MAKKKTSKSSQELLEELRTLLVHRAAQGERNVPSAAELAQQFQITEIRAQRLLRKLAQEGLIIRRQRAGSIIAPDLNVYIGLVMGAQLAEQPTGRHVFLSKLRNAIDRLVRGETKFMEPYGGTSGLSQSFLSRICLRVHEGINYASSGDTGSSNPIAALKSDLANLPYVGIVEYSTDITAILEDCNAAHLARVSHRARWPISTVHTVHSGLITESFPALVKSGSRRVFYVRTYLESTPEFSDMESLYHLAQEARMSVPSVIQLRENKVAPVEEQAFEEMVRHFDLWERNHHWPDAILVSDDHAARGILAAYFTRRPDKMPETIVSLAHEGIPILHGVEIYRFLFPTDDLVGFLLAELLAVIAGAKSEPDRHEITGRLIAPGEAEPVSPLSERTMVS